MVEKDVKVLDGANSRHPLTDEQLRQVCDNSTEVSVTVGFGSEDAPPPVIGVAKNLRVENGCVVADLYMREEVQLPSKVGRISCELLTKRLEINSICSLPTRDLGLRMVRECGIPNELAWPATGLSPGAGVPASDPRTREPKVWGWDAKRDAPSSELYLDGTVADPNIQATMRRVADQINKDYGREVTMTVIDEASDISIDEIAAAQVAGDFNHMVMKIGPATVGKSKAPFVDDPRMEVAVRKLIDRVNNNWKMGLNEEQRKFREDLLSLMKTPTTSADVEVARECLTQMGQPIDADELVRGQQRYSSDQMAKSLATPEDEAVDQPHFVGGGE